jgi:hypothetical protein
MFEMLYCVVLYESDFRQKTKGIKGYRGRHDRPDVHDDSPFTDV